MIGAILGQGARLLGTGLIKTADAGAKVGGTKAGSLLGDVLDKGSLVAAGYTIGEAMNGDEEAAPPEAAGAPQQEAPPAQVQSLPNGHKRITVDMDNPAAIKTQNALEAFGRGVMVQNEDGKKYMVYTLTDREFQRLNAGGL